MKTLDEVRQWRYFIYCYLGHLTGDFVGSIGQILLYSLLVSGLSHKPYRVSVKEPTPTKLLTG